MLIISLKFMTFLGPKGTHLSGALFAHFLHFVDHVDENNDADTGL